MNLPNFHADCGISFIDYNPNARPTVLLLHGLGADGSSWGFQFPALVESEVRVIAPDIPGFGKSNPPEGKWTIKNAATKVSQFLKALKIDQFVAVGISMGGVIALQLALDFPEIVERLVLVNTFASLRPKRLNEMVYMITRFVKANVRGVPYQAEMVAWRLFPQPEKAELRKEMIARILEANPKVYRQAMVSLGLFNAAPRLREIKMPTLVISGADDTTVSIVNQKALAQGIKGARHEVIQNAGHAVIVDQPDQFNQTLISFITEVS